MSTLSHLAPLILPAIGLAAYRVLLKGLLRGDDTHGRSRWARARDLWLLSSERTPGIVLGWLGGRLLRAPAEDNVLAFGVQRSGKTSTLVVPTLLEWRGACLATSTKDELVRLTASRRRGLGPVFVFAPLDSDCSWATTLGVRVVSWNPVGDAETAGAASGKDSPSAHWYLAAATLLTGLFMYERQQGGDLRSVLGRLNQTRPAAYVGLGSKAGAVAGEILSGIGTTPDREAGSIISTARSSLSLWLDERVAAATTATDDRPALDLDRLLAEGGTLYLVAPAEDAERCRPLFSALIGSLLRRATTRARALGGVLAPRLLLALDEVANFARIPRLDSYVSTGPGQGIQSLLCFHDLAQIEAGYGHERARTIWNNCRARLLLPGQGDPKTLEQFSRAIGDETIHFENRHWSDHGSGGSDARSSRPLASPDDLRRSSDTILVYANAPPARLRSRRWDQVRAWRSAVESSRSR
jgi:type IV secretion system protein VirD4